MCNTRQNQYNSQYLFKRAPDRFGGQQEDYLKRVVQLVQDASSRITDAVKTKRNLICVFHEELATLANIRKQIAVLHHTKDCEAFGFRRDDEESGGGLMLTALIGPYKEFNASLLVSIEPRLRQMNPNPIRHLTNTTSNYTAESCMDKKESADIWLATYEDSLLPVNAKAAKDLNESLKGIPLNIKMLRELKKSSPEKYKLLKFMNAHVSLRNSHPGSRKSDWALLTRRLEIDGKMCATSQYLTWMYRDFINDPFSKMHQESIISIIHLDPFLIDYVLADVAKLFEKILNQDSSDITLLTQQIALFVFELSHATPFKRGSAAVCEWFEMILFRIHGYILGYHPDKNVNLEALTLPLKEFIDKYPTFIQLEKLEYSQANSMHLAASRK